jgi:hypothetical protein
LDEKSVTEDFSATAADGKNYKTRHYNLDAIIAVGYRVNSKRATAFRRWARSVLRDFALRGYIIDKALRYQISSKNRSIFLPMALLSGNKRL